MKGLVESLKLPLAANCDSKSVAARGAVTSELGVQEI